MSILRRLVQGDLLIELVVKRLQTDSQLLRDFRLVAVVPFQPRSFDIWTLDKVAELIAEARGYNPTLRAVAVLNFADPQGPDNEAAATALKDAPGIEFLNTPIGRRKAFPNAAAEGRSVGELKRLDPKASAELAALIGALFDIKEIAEV